jgi:hypothetical protein
MEAHRARRPQIRRHQERLAWFRVRGPERRGMVGVRSPDRSSDSAVWYQLNIGILTRISMGQFAVCGPLRTWSSSTGHSGVFAIEQPKFYFRTIFTCATDAYAHDITDAREAPKGAL